MLGTLDCDIRSRRAGRDGRGVCGRRRGHARSINQYMRLVCMSASTPYGLFEAGMLEVEERQ